jgi:hypothetical protein
MANFALTAEDVARLLADPSDSTPQPKSQMIWKSRS